MHLVREILERSDELFVYHLGVVAQAIVEDVIENLPADAACVLVRDDDGGWHVEGASGLRETESQLVLDDDHWLVAQTVRSSAARSPASSAASTRGSLLIVALLVAAHHPRRTRPAPRPGWHRR